MQGYVCKVCGYIAIDGSAPDNCPVCHAPKTSFTDKLDAIKTAGGPSLGEPEKKHIPAITVVKKCGLIPDGCTDVHVKVGEITHPMTVEHQIVHIDCYLDKKFVARIILTPEKLNPAGALHMKVNSGVFTAISLCNLHGAWIKEVDLVA